MVMKSSTLGPYLAIPEIGHILHLKMMDIIPLMYFTEMVDSTIHEGFACHNQNLEVSCPVGNIEIIFANYGITNSAERVGAVRLKLYYPE